MTINEIIFMQIRIVRLFCNRYSLNVNDVHRLFLDNKIYELIHDCYGLYHCGSDELVFSDVEKILKMNGALACSKRLTLKNMKSNKVELSIDMVICMAIRDLALKENISEAEARDKLMSSKAVGILYDADNKVWTEGPDELIRLYKEIDC